LKAWDHILGAIEDDSVSTADLSDLEELKEQGTSKKRKKGNMQIVFKHYRRRKRSMRR
jgi:hypothetical protein